MADPVTVTCESACTVTHQVEISIPPFNLSVEAGAQISAAIALVWVVGWAARMLVRALSLDGKPTNQPEED